MNCKRFRYHLSVDPFSNDDALRWHSANCPDCAQRQRRAQAFEEQLRAALSLELEEAKGDPGSNDHRWTVSWIGVAGLLLLSVLVGVVWLTQRNGDGARASLVDLAVGHILSEQELQQGRDQNAEGRVRDLLASLGMRMEASLGDVSYAGRCMIGTNDSAHLVLPGRQGAVTALIMPSQRLDERLLFSRDGFDGLMMPVAGGVLAVVGQPGEAIAPVAAHLARALGWRSVR